MHSALAISMPGGMEWLALALLGLLLFGRRLPEVARSIGKSIVEFKRGMKDVQDDIHTASNSQEPNRLPSNQPKPDQLPPSTP